MKNIVLFCFLIVGNLNLFSQSDKEAILQTFSEYGVHVEAKDNVNLVEYLHPGMFEIAPKEMLIEMLDQAYADTMILLSIGSMRIDSLSEIMTENTNKYCLIHHNFDLTMKMLAVDDSAEAVNDIREAAVFTYEFIKEAYDEENVKFDKEKATFEIFIASQTFAINDEQTEGWKFIEAKKDSHIILKNILPKSVFKIVE